MYRSILNFMNYSVLLCLLTVFLFFTEPACASDDVVVEKKALQSVTLQLKWKHQFQFAGYYAALEKGYYRDAGLDVEILEIRDGEESIEQVVAGKADFGVAMSDLILHRAKGEPVVALAAVYQHSPLIILTPESNGIGNIHALKGKRLGMEAQSGELIAYLENEGISLENFQLVAHDYTLSSLISGKVDAISAYSTDEPFVLLDQGIEYSTFTPRAGGIDFYGETLFTSETQIEQHPERVADFLAASLKGWRYALENSEEIVDLILSEYSQRHSREHLLFEAEQSKSLIMNDVVPLGYMHIGRWQHIAQTYAKLGMLDENVSLDGFLYSHDSTVDYGPLKRAVWLLGVVCLLLGLGALILAFFNRKLTSEVDDRKRAEDALQRSELKFRSVFEDSAVGMAIIDPKGNFLSVNNSTTQILGFSKEELLKRRFQTLTYEEDVKTTTLLFSECHKSKKSYHIDNRYVAKDGGLVWGHTTVSPVFDSNGTFDYAIFHLLDLTKRKKVEASLVKSESLFRGLYDNMTSGSAIYEVLNDGSKGSDFIVKNFNQQSLAIEDKTLEQVLGKSLFELRPNIDDYGLIPVMKKVWETGEPAYFPMKMYQDEQYLNYFDNYLFKIPTGEVVTIYNDVTEQKNADIENRKLEIQLQQAQKMESIGNLAGGIAHDFNNILASIIGFTDLALEAAPKGSAQRNDLQEVCTAGHRAKELVQQILAFARQSKEETKPIRLNDIVSEVLKLVRPSTPATINIIPTLESNASVIANASQLHQIVMNLCTNAIYSMQISGGVLEISIRDTVLAYDSEQTSSTLSMGEYVELTVTDNGSGIDPTIMGKIFEPYFTTKAVGEGTGMGLAMVKGIVDSYKGDIQVRSIPGKTTSFIIRLPVAKEEMLDVVGVGDPAISGTEHVLLVDDEPPITRMGNRMLETLGYKVTTRNSSVEALELFKEQSDIFDLVITDMTMPFMTGDELSMEMRKIRRNIPIILCTGYSNKIDEVSAKHIAIDAFVYKPFTKADLAKTIRDVLGIH